METETEYAIIIEDDKGERKVCTKRFDGTPFKSATAAAIQSIKFSELFPSYYYDVVPIQQRAFAK